MDTGNLIGVYGCAKPRSRCFYTFRGLKKITNDPEFTQERGLMLSNLTHAPRHQGVLSSQLTTPQGKGLEASLERGKL